MTFDTIKQVVMEVLKENEKARDDDFVLTMNVYVKMGFARKLPLGIMIEYKNLDFAPAWETITRCRREIQHNMGQYKSSQQAQQRRISQEIEIHSRYGGKPVRYETMPNSWMSP